MTTIPQRLRDIADRVRERGQTMSSSVLLDIAAELESPASYVKVVAYIDHSDDGDNLSWEYPGCHSVALVTRRDHIATVAALQARIDELEARQAPVRPKGREVGRMGDMAPPGHSHMRVGLDGDSDVYVSVWEQERKAWAGIEFCTYSGGGKSPKTREALIALMAAIEADNADEPSHQWTKGQP